MGVRVNWWECTVVEDVGEIGELLVLNNERTGTVIGSHVTFWGRHMLSVAMDNGQVVAVDADRVRVLEGVECHVL